MTLTIALVAVANVVDARSLVFDRNVGQLRCVSTGQFVSPEQGKVPSVLVPFVQPERALIPVNSALAVQPSKFAQAQATLRNASAGLMNTEAIYASASQAAAQASKFARFANPRITVAGLVGSGVVGAGAYANHTINQRAQNQEAQRQAETAEYVAHANALMLNNNTQPYHPSRFESAKNSFNRNVGTPVVSTVQAHPYISTGAGLAAVAGVTAYAYNKGLFGKAFGKMKATFGKAKTAQTVQAAQPEVKKAVAPVAAALVKAKKAKHAKGKRFHGKRK